MSEQGILFEVDPRLAQLASLLNRHHWKHSDSVAVFHEGGTSYSTWTLTAADKAEFEQLRQGVPDAEIIQAVRSERG